VCVYHHCHHHHLISSTELGHLLTRSGLTHPEVSSKVYHDSFCQFGSSISLPWVIYFEAFYLHVVSSFSCILCVCVCVYLFVIFQIFNHLNDFHATFQDPSENFKFSTSENGWRKNLSQVRDTNAAYFTTLIFCMVRDLTKTCNSY